MENNNIKVEYKEHAESNAQSSDHMKHNKSHAPHKSVEELNMEWVVVFLFSFFLGTFGVHRFYVGKIGTGILMLVTFGGLGIWYFVDLILVILSKFTNKDGKVIRMFNRI